MNCHGSTLDLIFSSFRDIECNVSDEIVCNIDMYHPPIECNLKLTMSNCTYQPIVKYDSNHGDYKALNNFLDSFNWYQILNGDDIGWSLDEFYNIIYMAIDEFILKTIIKTDSYPPWFNSTLKSLIIDEKQAHLKYKKSSRYCDYCLFSALRAQCESLSESLHKNYICRTENALNTDPKFFWRYANRFKTESLIPDTVYLDGAVSENHSESVDLFALFSSKVFTNMADT